MIELQSITLRLTAHSLRQDCCGMSDWNLEGSADVAEWAVLHEARNDQHVAYPQVALFKKFNSDWWCCCTSRDQQLQVSQ